MEQQKHLLNTNCRFTFSQEASQRTRLTTKEAYEDETEYEYYETICEELKKHDIYDIKDIHTIYVIKQCDTDLHIIIATSDTKEVMITLEVNAWE